ncbi:hypothetical protein D5086_024926 [Populus alba]|uniref:Uncharacterized protein n=1 Tax=Populus alba TaxID=43335 RepID=A0ACC4B6V6_POPAL
MRTLKNSSISKLIFQQSDAALMDMFSLHTGQMTIMSAKHSMCESGDHDMEAPFLGTQAWIRSLNYSIVDDWQPWHFQGQVAGYTRTYSSQLTFATVKGGGHTAPAYRPAECVAMFGRWIIQEHL